MKRSDDADAQRSGLFIGSEPLEGVRDRRAAPRGDDDKRDGDKADGDTGDDDSTDSDKTDTDTTDRGDKRDTRDNDGKD